MMNQLNLFSFDFLTPILPVDMLTYTGIENITEKSRVRPMTKTHFSKSIPNAGQ